MNMIWLMPARACAIALALTLPLAAHADPGAMDPACERSGGSGARTTLVLKRSYLNKRGEFIGVFELRNDGISPALAVPGERRGGRFLVGPPDTRVDFQDLNGRWDTLLFGPISHYLPRPHALIVKEGRAVQFDAYLFPRDLVRKDGAAFTLTLYSNAPRHCVVSLPFTAVRAPRPVTRLVSAPVPPIVGWIEETDVNTKRK